MQSNVSYIDNCYGCGMCASSCPKRIIEISLNAKGFYEPKIQYKDACISCGICLNVCSYIDKKIAVGNSTPMACYASWSNDADIRKICSSGGVGFEIAKYLINKGYKVVGVRYDVASNRAVHYISETCDDLSASIGSKYIQSFTTDAFMNISKKEKYLITGTPCQIDSFRRYIRKFKCDDNFVLMDFFCHGVPSMHLWNKYSKSAQKITGKIVSVSWRNKTNGWHDSWDMNILGKVREELTGRSDSYNLLIRDSETFMSHRWSHGNLFFKMFLSNSCLGKACYDRCKYKGVSSSADIRIGDLWGKTYEKDEKGVSGVVAFTEKGEDILNQLNCQRVEHPWEIVTEGQLHHKLKKPLSHGFICWLLKTNVPLKLIFYVVQLTRLPYLLKCKLKI